MTDNTNNTVAGTVHFNSGDKTVVGTATSFTGISNSDLNKILYADGTINEVAAITDNNNLELFAKSYGPTQDANGVNFALSFQLFSTKSFGSSIQNMTILHTTSNPDNCIELQGMKNTLSNIYFKNLSNLSTFIAVPKDNNEISLLSIIKDCRFVGGTIGIKLNNTKFTSILNSSFMGQESKSIEVNINQKYTLIDNCNFSNTNRGILYTDTSTYLKVTNSTFEYTTLLAIDINNTGVERIGNIIIDKCYFNECYPGYRSLFFQAENLKIINSIFEGGTTQIWFDQSKNVTISKNTFKNWFTRAIDMNSFDTLEKFTITENKFIAEIAETVTEDGIRIYGSSHTISNNTFANIEENACDIKGNSNTVSNNTFNNCDTAALLLAGELNTCSLNTFKDCTDSTQITGTKNNYIANTITDDLNIGLYITGDNNIISSNNIHDSTGNNIELTSAADKCIVTSNISLGSGGTNLLNNGTNTSLNNNIE